MFILHRLIVAPSKLFALLSLPKPLVTTGLPLTHPKRRCKHSVPSTSEVAGRDVWIHAQGSRPQATPFGKGCLLALGVSLVLPPVFWFTAQSASALQVQVTPANPKLGDTLSVTVQYGDRSISATPTITLGQRTFQTFLVAPNQFRTLLPTTPLDRPGTLKLQATGGGEAQSVTVTLRKRSFPTQSIWLPPGKGSDGTDYEFDRVDAFKKLVTPEKFWNGPFLKPNQGEITTIYGVRRYYNGKFANDYYHRGVDYAGAHGSPVVAPAAGRVMLVGRVSQGFQLHGNTVGLDHGQGVASIFLHLSRIDVKEGQFVKAGQVIGAVGATGAVTGPHLHWGLYVHGKSVDPLPWRTKGFE